MASEWPLRPLAEMSVNFDTQRKPVKEAERVAGPYPYYGASGIVDHVNGYLFDGDYLLVAEDGENLRTRNTPIAFRATGKFWVNNHAHILQGNENASTRYLEYALLAADITPYLTGAVMPKLTQGNLNKIELPCPSLEEQRAIAETLGALDDRIDNLRQTNATLEAIAAALFKSWFVDFDGVSPEDMQKSELGLIPKGWRVGALGDVAEHPRRGIQPESIETGTPYIALEHMPRRCIALNDWGLADDLESNKYEFKKGEILFGKLRPYFHKVGIAPLDGVCSTDIVVVAPKSPAWFAFVLAVTSDIEFVEYTNAGSTGTKMPRTSWAEMARYPLVLPPHSLVLEFNRQVEPMAEKIIANIHESRTLATLRDTLLPRLISGRLRVAEVPDSAEDRRGMRSWT